MASHRGPNGANREETLSVTTSVWGGGEYFGPLVTTGAGGELPE